MRIIYALSISILLFYTSVQGQQRPNRPGNRAAAKIALTGVVIDVDTEAPLEFATITLFSQRDSAIAGGNITDIEGKFRIEARPGRYYAKVEFISYQSQIIEQINLSAEQPITDIGTVQLASDANMLAEVEVVEERSTMQMSLDKKIFNVGKDLANTGGSAQDILDNVPSVTVDVDGNVSLRGSGNVRILVDGKPSGLIGIGGTSGLRQLPANLIERIEVITNPSARYEAEGMAGIINIVLRKERKKGLNGSFDFTVGYPANYGTAINLNMRRKKFNFFTNIGVNYRKNPGGGNLYQEFRTSDPTRITDQTREHERGGWGNNFRFGADYYFSEKSIITTSFLYRGSREDNETLLEYRDYLEAFKPENQTTYTTRSDDEIEEEANLEYVLSYKRLFDRKGQEFRADLRFQDNNEKESSDFLEQYFDPDLNPNGDPDFQQRSANEEGERRMNLQLDYVHPFGKEGKFETGLFNSLRRIKNDFNVEDRINNDWIKDLNLSDDFTYDEGIAAGYAIYGNKIRGFSYQVGLRGELTDVKTELDRQEAETTDTTYFNLFPSAFVNYEFENQNAVQISYSRRIRRPRFWDLNPFFTLSDARNYFSGNPNLGPEFTDSYEIGHIKYWDKGSLSSSIFYRHTTDVIQRIRRDTPEDPDFDSRTQPENLSTRDDIGLEFTFSADALRWWRLDGNVNIFRSIIEGRVDDQIFDADTYTWFGRLTSRMTLWKSVDFQLRFNYRAARETTQGRQRGMGHLDIGLSKEIFNKKGNLTLSVRDAFNTRRRFYTITEDDYFADGDFQWRARTTTLTLSYRLNQQKRRGRGGRRGSSYGGEGGGEF